jgi:Cu/Zn superoxide dismutase
MLRLRTAAMTAAATAALLVAPTTAFAHSPDGGHGSGGRFSISHNAGPLRDLQPTVASAFDQASASVVMVGWRRSSYFSLLVHGVNPAVAGQRYGAHLHTGPCVAGDPNAAGPHYNTDVLAGVDPPEISPDTEVWLDFTVSSRGRAHSDTRVPFKPKRGQRSIVIHAEPTMDNGVAGARVACLPLRIR